MGRTLLQDPPFELRQFFNDRELRGIAFDPAGGDGGGVTLCDGARDRDGNHEFALGAAGRRLRIVNEG